MKYKVKIKGHAAINIKAANRDRAITKAVNEVKGNRKSKTVRKEVESAKQSGKK